MLFVLASAESTESVCNGDGVSFVQTVSNESVTRLGCDAVGWATPLEMLDALSVPIGTCDHGADKVGETRVRHGESRLPPCNLDHQHTIWWKGQSERIKFWLFLTWLFFVTSELH